MGQRGDDLRLKADQLEASGGLDTEAGAFWTSLNTPANAALFNNVVPAIPPTLSWYRAIAAVFDAQDDVPQTPEPKWLVDWEIDFSKPDAWTKYQSMFTFDGTRQNYGAGSGGHLDNISLRSNETWDQVNGVLLHRAAHEDKPDGIGGTAHYTGTSVSSSGLYVLKPLQMVTFDGRFDPFYRPCWWTTSPASGDDAEFDFEFFNTSGDSDPANDNRLHIGGIKQYSPMVKDQIELPWGTEAANRHVYGIERVAASQTDFTIDGVLKKTSTLAVPPNDHRVRVAHQVGGDWDDPEPGKEVAYMTLYKVTVWKRNPAYTGT